MSYVLVDKPIPHTSVITLNRPERMNSMAFEAMIPFREAIEAVAADNDTTCVILTGRGVAFAPAPIRSICSGISPGVISRETAAVKNVTACSVPMISKGSS